MLAIIMKKKLFLFLDFHYFKLSKENMENVRNKIFSDRRRNIYYRIN